MQPAASTVSGEARSIGTYIGGTARYRHRYARRRLRQGRAIGPPRTKTPVLGMRGATERFAPSRTEVGQRTIQPVSPSVPPGSTLYKGQVLSYSRLDSGLRDRSSTHEKYVGRASTEQHRR